jgi:hypothetical protein
LPERWAIIASEATYLTTTAAIAREVFLVNAEKRAAQFHRQGSFELGREFIVERTRPEILLPISLIQPIQRLGNDRIRN